MTFGEKVRAARKVKQIDLRTLAGVVGVHFTYLSKIENGKLDFGNAPGEGLILKLAAALDADADELLLLAHRIPERIRKRVLERPDVFGRLADMDDESLDALMVTVGERRSGPLPKSRSRRGTGGPVVNTPFFLSSDQRLRPASKSVPSSPGERENDGPE